MNLNASNITNQLTVKATTENLSVVRQFLASFGQKHGLSTKDVFDVQLAVDEAFTNIIKHAYNFDDSREVLVKIDNSGTQLIVQLIDNGQAFNPETYRKPNVKDRIKQKKRGGVGVYLMTKLMDEVSYDQMGAQNVITMAKYLL